MTLQEIKDAIADDKTVHWVNEGYEVVKGKSGYVIVCKRNGHTSALTRADGVTMQEKPAEFFIKRNPKETNTEFLERMMERAKCGIVMQLFIFDALGKWSERVTDTGLDEIRKQWGDNFLVHPEAWFAAAQELRGELRNRLGD